MSNPSSWSGGSRESIGKDGASWRCFAMAISIVLPRVTGEKSSDFSAELLLGRAIFRGNGLHHVLLSERFGGGLFVSDGHELEFAVVVREKKLLDGMRLVGSPGE